MTDREKRIGGVGVGIHEIYTYGKGYFAGRLDRRQV